MVEVHVPRVPTVAEAEEDNRVTIVSLRRQLAAMEENMHKMEREYEAQIEIMTHDHSKVENKRIGSINELMVAKRDDQKVIAQLLEDADRVKVLNKDLERELEECKKTIAWHDENDQATWDVAVKEKKYKKLKKRLKLVRQQLKC